MSYEQLSLFDIGQEQKEVKKEKIKPLIWSLSLTWHRTICPYCKMDNPDSEVNHSKFNGWNLRLEFWDSPLDICPNCGKRYDRDNPEVRMSRDYAECEALGLKGAVRKNEKGKWEQVYP